MKEFDFIKDKWYIHCKSKEESIAAQEWLFSISDISWRASGRDIIKLSGDSTIISNYYSKSKLASGKLMLGSQVNYTDEALEIKLDFENVLKVKSFTLPVVETESQRKVRELEETIAKATKQIEELKAGM